MEGIVLVDDDENMFEDLDEDMFEDPHMFI
jgi:hypothetical protein